MITVATCYAWQRTSLATLLIVTVSVILVSGCGKNYGRFTKDNQVSLAFRSGTVQPGLNYYYAGRDTIPYAIIGIDKSYTVPSRYWIPFEPQPEQLKKMSANIYGYHHNRPYGSTILTPEGNFIGVWYSNVFERTVRVDKENLTVEVLFVNPESYNGGFRARH